MLTDAELAAMRETAEAALPDSAVITRRTRTADGGGGGSLSWAASSTVDARYAPTGGDEALVSEQLVGQVDGIVTLPYDADVVTTDRVVVGGSTHEVLAILEHETWSLMKRLAVKRVR